MTALGIPPPLDSDDDDVAWALQTAQVQWNRGSVADAIVWLRRAVEAAIAVGQVPRAAKLNEAVTQLTEQMVSDVVHNAPGVDPRDAIDSLLDGGTPGRRSIDVEFDDVTSVASANPFLDAATSSDNPFLDSGSVSPGPWQTEPAPPPEQDVPLPRFAIDSELDHSVTDMVTAAQLFAELEGGRGMDFDDTTAAQEMESQEPPLADPPLPPIDHEDEPTLAVSPEYAPDPPPTRSPSVKLEPSVPPPTELAADPETDPYPVAPSREIAAELATTPISLEDVPGLQDLPPEAQELFVARARVVSLDVDEEVSQFAVALVLDGWVSIMAAIADASSASANPGGVVFTRGSLEEGIALRVVSGESDTRVAIWDADALEDATAACPWVADELRLVADRLQALAGVTMGLLGERLDEGLREEVTKRCEVRCLEANEVFVEQGATVPGMHIVGAGWVELVREDDSVEQELHPGEFLYATEVLSAGPAHARARAGSGGALVLFADRKVAHELLVSVPPLLEVLAG